jgi:hypothetical protein
MAAPPPGLISRSFSGSIVYVTTGGGARLICHLTQPYLNTDNNPRVGDHQQECTISLSDPARYHGAETRILAGTSEL